MNCPKCGTNIPEGTTTCPSCGFSSTIDGVSVQPTIVEAPVIPDIVSAPVVDENNVEKTSVEESSVVQEVQEAPVVDAPVVEAPVVDAPVVEAPVVDAPVVEAPIVDAPVVEAPTVEAPVVDAPTVEAPAVENASPVSTTPAVETPVPSMEQPTSNQNSEVKPVEVAPKEKKNIAIYIVIGVLTVIALSLVVLLIVNGSNSKSIGNINSGDIHETDETNENTNENTTSDNGNNESIVENVKNGVITLYNIKFLVPEGFEVDNSDDYYSIFNTSLKKVFILQDMYTGDEVELNSGLNIMKSEYPENGCTDLSVEVLQSDNIKYGLLTYKYEGTSYNELYALLNDKYIIAFYNLQTDLVTKDEFVQYSLEVAKSGKDQGATFSDSSVIAPWDHTRKDINFNYTFE